MSWPNNPTNGQQTTVAGIVYQYDAINLTWDRVFASLNLANVSSVPTVTYGSQPNITSLGTLASLDVAGTTVINGNLTVTGSTEYLNTINLRIQDPLIELGGGANGAALTTNDNRDRGMLLHYYSTIAGKAIDGFIGWDNSGNEFAIASNVSVTGEVATFNTYGNVRSGYFLGDGSQLTGTIANANYSAFSGAATTAATVTTNAQPNITSVGTLASLAVTGVTTATGGVRTANIQDASGTVTIQTKYNSVSGDAGITSNLVVGTSGTGSVTATNFAGSGNTLTNLNASNIASGTIPSSILGNSTHYIGTTSIALNRASGAQSLTGITSIDGYASTVSTAAQPNITSLGTLASVTHSANSNVTLSGSLSQITGANLLSGTFLTGTLTTALQPNITSLGSLANLTITGLLTNGPAAEVVVASSSVSASPTNYNLNSGATFYHSGISLGSNWTVNIQNVPTTDARSIVFTIIVVQGATPYIPNALTIDNGVAQTIKWSNGVAPAGKASAIDIFSFALIRTGASLAQVLGSYTTYS